MQIPVLLGTQTLFNIGFYAVIPFLALVLTGDFGLSAAAVGLVLGVRTFAQQGLFLVGGTLSDSWGPRGIILVGVGVRTAGFALLAAALPLSSLPLFLVGTVLSGLGGALFSPGLNTLIAEAGTTRDAGRVSLFAWLTITGELGAVLGPVVGAALLGFGFAVVATSGAVYFAAIGVLLAVLLPRRDRKERPARVREATPEDAAASTSALRDTPFVRFALLHAVDLLAYNQLYLAVPLLLAVTADPGTAVAGAFVWISVLTLGAQLPLARWSAGRGAAIALRTGYLCSGGGFVLAGVSAMTAHDVRLIVVIAAATAFGLGHLLANPTALQLVPRLAPEARRGSYFGLLASCGGVAVLLGNVLIGTLSDLASPQLAWLPWAVMALFPLASAVWAPGILRAHPRWSSSRNDHNPIR